MVTIAEALTQVETAEESALERQRQIKQAEARAKAIRVGGTLLEQQRFGTQLKSVRRQARKQRGQALEQVEVARGELRTFRGTIAQRKRDIASAQVKVREQRRLIEEEKAARKAATRGTFDIGASRKQRERASQEQERLQSIAKRSKQIKGIKALGLDPVFAKRELTGFESDISQQSIPFTDVGLKALSQEQLTGLEKIGLVDITRPETVFEPKVETQQPTVTFTRIADPPSFFERVKSSVFFPLPGPSILEAQIRTIRDRRRGDDFTITQTQFQDLLTGTQPGLDVTPGVLATEDPFATPGGQIVKDIFTPSTTTPSDAFFTSLGVPTFGELSVGEFKAPSLQPSGKVLKGAADIQDVQKQDKSFLQKVVSSPLIGVAGFSAKDVFGQVSRVGGGIASGIRGGFERAETFLGGPTLGDIQGGLRQERATELISGFESLTPTQAETRALAGEKGFGFKTTPEGRFITFDTGEFASDIKGAGSLEKVRGEKGTGGFATAGVRSFFIGAGKFGLSVPEFIVEDIFLGGFTRVGTAEQLAEGPQVSFFDKRIFGKAKGIPGDPVQTVTGFGLTATVLAPSAFRTIGVARAEGLGSAVGGVAFEFSPIKLKPGVFTPDLAVEQIRGSVRDIGIEGQPDIQTFAGRGVDAPELTVTSLGVSRPLPGGGTISASVTGTKTPFIELGRGRVDTGTFEFVTPSVPRTGVDSFRLDTQLGRDVIAELDVFRTEVTTPLSIDRVLGGEKTLGTTTRRLSIEEQFIFGTDISPSITTQRLPFIQDFVRGLPKPSTVIDPFGGKPIKTGRTGLLDFQDSAIESLLPRGGTPPPVSSARIFGTGERIRLRVPEIEDTTGLGFQGGTGRKTPFTVQETKVDTTGFTSGVASALKSTSKQIKTQGLSLQDPRFGFPTIVGGLGSRGAFTGLGLFERTDQVLVRRGRTTDGGLTGVDLGRETKFGVGTITTFRDRFTSVNLIGELQGTSFRGLQGGRFVSPQITAPLTIPAFGTGILLETPERTRQREITTQLFDFGKPQVPSTRTIGGFGIVAPARGGGGLFPFPPFLGGSGGRGRRVRGRKKRKVRIRPSFTATALDLIGPLPKPTVLGGIDIGILPGRIRRIPVKRKKKGKRTKSRRATTKRKTRRKKR